MIAPEGIPAEDGALQLQKQDQFPRNFHTHTHIHLIKGDLNHTLIESSSTQSQPGHSVLTDKLVRFVRLLQTSVPRNQQPIGVLENRKPSSSVSVESVRFLGSTELTEAEV